MRTLAGMTWKWMYSRKEPRTSCRLLLVESQYFLLHIRAAFKDRAREKLHRQRSGVNLSLSFLKGKFGLWTNLSSDLLNVTYKNGKAFDSLLLLSQFVTSCAISTWNFENSSAFSSSLARMSLTTC